MKGEEETEVEVEEEGVIIVMHLLLHHQDNLNIKWQRWTRCWCFTIRAATSSC